MSDERHSVDGHMRFYDRDLRLNVNVLVDRLNDYGGVNIWILKHIR